MLMLHSPCRMKSGPLSSYASPSPCGPVKRTRTPFGPRNDENQHPNMIFSPVATIKSSPTIGTKHQRHSPAKVDPQHEDKDQLIALAGNLASSQLELLDSLVIQTFENASQLKRARKIIACQHEEIKTLQSERDPDMVSGATDIVSSFVELQGELSSRKGLLISARTHLEDATKQLRLQTARADAAEEKAAALGQQLKELQEKLETSSAESRILKKTLVEKDAILAKLWATHPNVRSGPAKHVPAKHISATDQLAVETLEAVTDLKDAAASRIEMAKGKIYRFFSKHHPKANGKCSSSRKLFADERQHEINIEKINEDTYYYLYDGEEDDDDIFDSEYDGRCMSYKMVDMSSPANSKLWQI